MNNTQTTGKITELVDVLEQGILPKEELNKAYLELLTLVEEGERVYGEVDFNIYLPKEHNTLETKKGIINKGFYKEFSNLVGLSLEPKQEDIDLVRLNKGMFYFIWNKFKPWLAWDEATEDGSYIKFYKRLSDELNALNTIYLKDEGLEQTLKEVKVGIHRLSTYS